MKKKFFLLAVFCIASYYAYAQEYNMMDVIIESYKAYYNFSSAEQTEKQDVKKICPPEPEDFHRFFNTKFIDFASIREGGVKTFSFSDSLHLPLKQNLIITSNYGMRGNRKHYGVDFRLNVGDTIFSVFCGKIRITKWDNTYGYVVVARHYNMSETVYAHLSKILVAVDQEVVVGDPIGLGGNTGQSSGPHLHFELRYKGFPINPIVNRKFLSHTPF